LNGCADCEKQRIRLGVLSSLQLVFFRPDRSKLLVQPHSDVFLFIFQPGFQLHLLGLCSSHLFPQRGTRSLCCGRICCDDIPFSLQRRQTALCILLCRYGGAILFD
jgi:hypothetical protein